MKISGIYCIKNIKNGKVYPGSAVNVEKRWRKHKKLLRENRHHSKHLQNSWNKYGEGYFEFLVIEECLKNELLIREQVQLDAVRVRDPDGTLGEIDHNLAYNTCPIAGSSLGVKHSEEAKKKMSEDRKGKHPSEEARRNMSKARKGVPKSEEHKKKLSDAQKGVPKSEEHKKKMSEALSGERSVWFGKHHSEEYKKKMSEAVSGEKNPMYGMNGEKHPAAKLTWEKVGEIREKWVSGNYFQTQLAAEYGVSEGCIAHIVKNRTWKE